MPRQHDPETSREPSRLYLVVPAYRSPEDLTAVLEAGDVACILLLTTDLDDNTLRQAIARLRPLAQERGIAFLLQDQVGLAAETGCDGVHLGDPTAYGAARQRLGDGAIVGVGCDASRHAAMTAAEKDADYVAFGAPEPALRKADPELLSWWQDLMTVPCVAFGADSPEESAVFAAAGADFVAVSATVWVNPEGAPAGLTACAQALAKAVKSG